MAMALVLLDLTRAVAALASLGYALSIVAAA
jgi:hypothetical protein